MYVQSGRPSRRFCRNPLLSGIMRPPYCLWNTWLLRKRSACPKNATSTNKEATSTIVESDSNDIENKPQLCQILWLSRCLNKKGNITITGLSQWRDDNQRGGESQKTTDQVDQQSTVADRWGNRGRIISRRWNRVISILIMALNPHCSMSLNKRLTKWLDLVGPLLCPKLICGPSCRPKL